MNFIFSKELIDNDPTTKRGKRSSQYKILDAKNNLLGQFFHSSEEPLIYVGDKEISIDTVSKFLKKTKHFLVDNKDRKQIGEYEILGGHGIDHFWKDIPSSPTGTIKLNDTLFNFRRVAPDVRYSFLKQETWGYFKFRLYAIERKEFYEYCLKMDVPIYDKPNQTKWRPFLGTIESNSDNILAILAGLYLMEIEFAFEDSKNNG